uniref:RING-type domain-containing protein n=1 Tax=viral metagenome TaxID=1070528 RepID=A0A6C0B349_9ZZZZ
MVCYLCNDYTYEPLVNCGNLLCKIYFHKSCWEKYLKSNNLEKSICKVCYIGKINIHNTINNGEVQICGCSKLFKNRS